MVHSKFSLVLLSFLTWYDSCMSCAPPDLLGDDGDDNNNSSVDTSTVDSDDTFDPGIPPPCDFEETEPNNTPSEADDIETELWACGVLAADSETGGSESATDFVKFTVPESGWISMWARAEDIGSFADLEMTVAFNRDTDAVLVGSVKHAVGTRDPKVMLPVNAGDVIDVGIVNSAFSSGDQQVWEFLATAPKDSPTSWNRVEEEAADEDGLNDDRSDASLVLESGDRIFGVLGARDEGDSFLIEIPPGSWEVDLDVDAYDVGAPIDARLALFRPDPDSDAEDGYSQASADNNGPGADLDPDPQIIIDIEDEPGTWIVKVTNVGTFKSPYHWYVLGVTLTPTGSDSGAP